MRISFCLFFLCSIASIYGQKKENYNPEQKAIKSRRSYMNINYFRINEIPLTLEDSLNFKFKDNDTLVLLTPSNYTFKKGGVRVLYEYESEDFLSIYKNVVYGTDNADSTNHKYMRYWKEPVTIYFHSSVPKEHSQKLQKFAKMISENIDSLKIQVVDNWDDSNYTVYYASEKADPRIENRIKNGTSGYYIQWSKSKIFRGALKIDTDYAKTEFLQIEQLKYHFLKSLGHFSTSSQLSCKNYFSACPSIRKFTALDQELLAYHYSYGICKGTDLKTFTEQHKKAKELLLASEYNSMYFTHFNK